MLLKRIDLKFFYIVIVCILIFLFAVSPFFSKRKDYYEVLSRVEKVHSVKVDSTLSLDTVGWLRVQGTSLDIPIVFSKDITNYGYPATEENYVWILHEKAKLYNQFNISGHNIFNLSSEPLLRSVLFYRFEELMSFVYYDFAKENEYIQITFNDHDYLYKIISVGFMEKDQYHDFVGKGNLSKKEIKKNIIFWKKNSIFDYRTSYNEKDKYVTLFTCTRFFGAEDNYSFYVTGRLLRKGEKNSRYSVSMNSNYDKILSILKGDNENDENI